MSAFTITRLVFGPASTRIYLTRNAQTPRMSTPELAAFCLKARPTLQAHACQNDGARTFGDVIDHTLVAHLLEHLIIDILVELTRDEQASFAGVTEVLDAKEKSACITITCAHDVLVCKALREAHLILSKGVTHLSLCHQHI